MFTSDAARIIGITPKALRVFLRNQNMAVGSGARYEFSYEEVEKLGKKYWASQPQQASNNSRREDEGTPGLPCEWLPDPEKLPVFLAERKARLERMSKRLREVGLDVPQMTEQMLKVNCRALASALLGGRPEDDES